MYRKATLYEWMPYHLKLQIEKAHTCVISFLGMCVGNSWKDEVEGFMTSTHKEFPVFA